MNATFDKCFTLKNQLGYILWSYVTYRYHVDVINKLEIAKVTLVNFVTDEIENR